MYAKSFKHRMEVIDTPTWEFISFSLVKCERQLHFLHRDIIISHCQYITHLVKKFSFIFSYPLTYS